MTTVIVTFLLLCWLEICELHAHIDMSCCFCICASCNCGQSQGTYTCVKESEKKVENDKTKNNIDMMSFDLIASKHPVLVTFVSILCYGRKLTRSFFCLACTITLLTLWA